MKQKRKTYTPEFKREAVALVTQQNDDYAQASRILKINANMLRLGQRAARRGSPSLPRERTSDA